MAVVLAASSILAAAPPVLSGANGTWEARDRGCYCHGDSPSPNVGFTVKGLPGHYTPGANYTIDINVTLSDVRVVANKSQGGFYLEATAGSLSIPSNMIGLIQVDGNASTHTRNGSHYRHWQVNWTAPPAPNLIITFFVFVNTVDGGGSETFNNDHWTSRTVRIGVGDEPEIKAPAPKPPPMAMETYALLAFAIIVGGASVFMFLQARRPPPEESDESPGEEPLK